MRTEHERWKSSKFEIMHRKIKHHWTVIREYLVSDVTVKHSYSTVNKLFDRLRSWKNIGNNFECNRLPRPKAFPMSILMNRISVVIYPSLWGIKLYRNFTGGFCVFGSNLRGMRSKRNLNFRIWGRFDTVYPMVRDIFRFYCTDYIQNWEK